MVAAEARGRLAAWQAAGTLPWTGERLQADHAARVQGSANFQLGGPEKLTGAHDPRHVLPFLQDSDVANARVGAERNPLKTESHLLRERPGCSATPVLNWRRAEHGQNLCSHRRQHHARSRCQFITDQLLSKAEVIRAMRERVQLCQDPQTAVSTTSCGFTATQSGNIARQRSTTSRAAVSRTALPGSHRGQHDASDPQRRPVLNWVQKSARHRCSCTSGSSHRSHTAHPWYDPRRSLGRPSP